MMSLTTAPTMKKIPIMEDESKQEAQPHPNPAINQQLKSKNDEHRIDNQKNVKNESKNNNKNDVQQINENQINQKQNNNTKHGHEPLPVPVAPLNQANGTGMNQMIPIAVTSHFKYKYQSKHGGQPLHKYRDLEFTNPPSFPLQRWELLESAKRWLPGEGSLITKGQFRYLIGPPIHMGMNGHIHYCYKYKMDSRSDSSKVPKVETFAAKIVPNTPEFAREIVTLRNLQGPGCDNIVPLLDVLSSAKTLISILELAQADAYRFFVSGGSRKHGWNLDKPAVREHFCKMIIKNVVEGLYQMHSRKYIHCDLKSLNVLLCIYITKNSHNLNGVYIKAKLTDFGHSSLGLNIITKKLFSNGMARVGTAGHVAPELFKPGTKCTYKIDIWSLGIVMFSILVPGRLLFKEYTNLDLLNKEYYRVNKLNPYSKETRPSWWSDFEQLSPESRDLILWMTRYNPKERPSTKDILKHDWFLIGKKGYRENYRPKLKYLDKLGSTSMHAQE